MQHAAAFGLDEVRRADWTESVRRFWPAVIFSALRPRNLWGLLRSGFKTIRGALVMPLMIRGQRKGTIKFALTAARKPVSEVAAPEPATSTTTTTSELGSETAQEPEVPPSISEPVATPQPEPAPVIDRVAPQGFEWGGSY